jgi:hypothetical protein
MKTIKILLVLIGILALSSICIAETISVNVSQVSIIRPAANEVNTVLGPRILIKFDLPNELYQKEVGYSEITCPLSLTSLNVDSMINFKVYALINSWTENADWSSPWHNAGGDYDTTFSFESPFSCSNDNQLNLDISYLVQSWASDSTSNHGIIIIPQMQNLNSFRAFPNIVSQIRSSILLKIIVPE